MKADLFAVVNFAMDKSPLWLSLGAPVTASLIVFLTCAFVGSVPREVDELMDQLSHDATEV